MPDNKRRPFFEINRPQINTAVIERHLSTIAQCLQVLTEHLTGKMVGELAVSEEGTSEVMYTDEEADAAEEIRTGLSKLRAQWEQQEEDERQAVRDKK